MLSQRQVDEYHEKGFVIPNYRLPERDLKKISDISNKLVEEYSEFRDYCPTVLAFETGFLQFARIQEILDFYV